MSAVTERLRFLISVCVLPLRHPVFAAKSNATASIRSNGGLTVGISAGWASEIQSRDELPGILGKLRGFHSESERSGGTFGAFAALRDVYDLEVYRALGDLGVTEMITAP